MSDEDLNPPTMTRRPEQEGFLHEEDLPQAATATPAFQTSRATVKRRQRHLLERLRRSVSPPAP